MIDGVIRHWFPGIDPMKLTVHQCITWYDEAQNIEMTKSGEVNHRRIVEREAKRQERILRHESS